MSEFVKDIGLCLKRTPHLEANAIVAVFTRSMGVLDAYMRSVRKSKGQFAIGAEPLTLGIYRFLLRERRPIVVEFRLLEFFANIKSRWERFEPVGKVLGFLAEVMPREEPNPAFFRDLINGLEFMNGAKDVDTLSWRFWVVLRFFARSGWVLDPTRCISCGRPLGGDAFWVAEDGGFRCSVCFDGRGKAVSQEVLSAIRGALVFAPESFCTKPVPKEALRVLLEHVAYRTNMDIGSIFREGKP